MKLTTKARKRLKPDQFAGPDRSFPINDESHARAAISGATRAVRAGNITPAAAKRIKAEARAKLRKPKWNATKKPQY